MEVVWLPVYSWGCAAGHAIRMAARLTGRHEVLCPASLDPERLAVIASYCEPPEMPRHIEMVAVEHDPATAASTWPISSAKLSDRTAAVYLENPSYLGRDRDQRRRDRRARARRRRQLDRRRRSDLAGRARRRRRDYGADIVVGPTQPLGVHMNARRRRRRLHRHRATRSATCASTRRFLSAFPTAEPGEFGFGIALFDQTSYGMREAGKDWTGNSVYLWAIGRRRLPGAARARRACGEVGEAILRAQP